MAEQGYRGSEGEVGTHPWWRCLLCLGFRGKCVSGGGHFHGICEDYLIPNLRSPAWSSLQQPEILAGWGEHCSSSGFLRKGSQQSSHC